MAKGKPDGSGAIGDLIQISLQGTTVHILHLRY
jgi:hypothetical protein